MKKIDPLRINGNHRKKLNYYLKEFYKKYPNEKHTLFHFVKYFKNRLKHQNKDAWTAVCGDTGSGKSLFTLMTMVLFGRPMQLEKNVSYIPKGEEISQKFEKLKFQSFLIDEAAQAMRKHDWQNKAQQKVNTAAMTERFKNNWVFLNMPNFNEFTKSMRASILLFRAIVVYRTENYARVIVQRRSRNWRSEDPWGDKKANDMYEKIEKKYKEISNDIILKIERNIPNTIMDFIVPNLELILPDVVANYEALKLASRDVVDEMARGDKRNIYKEKYEKIMVRVTKLLKDNTLDIGKVRLGKHEILKAMDVSEYSFDKYYREPLPEIGKIANFRVRGGEKVV